MPYWIVCEYLNAKVASDCIQPWIDYQANIFTLIVVGLLSVWVLREFMESFLKLRREEIIQLGMNYIFSLNDNTRNRIQ